MPWARFSGRYIFALLIFMVGMGTGAVAMLKIVR